MYCKFTSSKMIKNDQIHTNMYKYITCARGGTRTLTGLRPQRFKRCMSADFITRADLFLFPVTSSMSRFKAVTVGAKYS